MILLGTQTTALHVSGNADITTNNYTQNGAIDVTGALAISAIGDFTNFIAGSINAATLAITVTIDNDGSYLLIQMQFIIQEVLLLLLL